jgi:hypothetical protein
VRYKWEVRYVKKYEIVTTFKEVVFEHYTMSDIHVLYSYNYAYLNDNIQQYLYVL